jgi:hypothetical protein
VGYTKFPVISDRLNNAGAGYSRKVGKKMYATFYTEKVTYTHEAMTSRAKVELGQPTRAEE